MKKKKPKRHGASRWPENYWKELIGPCRFRWSGSKRRYSVPYLRKNLFNTIQRVSIPVLREIGLIRLPRATSRHGILLAFDGE